MMNEAKLVRTLLRGCSPKQFPPRDMGTAWPMARSDIITSDIRRRCYRDCTFVIAQPLLKAYRIKSALFLTPSLLIIL